jgi:hypothetical protein
MEITIIEIVLFFFMALLSTMIWFMIHSNSKFNKNLTNAVDNQNKINVEQNIVNDKLNKRLTFLEDEVYNK